MACGVALRRLAFRTIVRASTDSLQAALGATQFGVSYPGGAEACKLGLETTLIISQQAFLHARGDGVNPVTEGFSDYALQHETWQAVLTRFNLDMSLQERIRLLRAREQDFLVVDQYARPAQPEHVDPQHTLRAYMDDQYAGGPPDSLAFECALIGIISQHHAGLVPNIDKGKLKTGMFIPHEYDRIEELKAGAGTGQASTSWGLVDRSTWTA